MIEKTALTEPLDVFLREIVKSLHAAVNLGIRSLETDPATADRALQDCTETLGVIMAGRVKEWIAA